MHIIIELWYLLHCALDYFVSGIVQWCVRRGRWGEESNCCCLKTYRDGIYYIVLQDFVAICEVCTIRIQHLIKVRGGQVLKVIEAFIAVWMNICLLNCYNMSAGEQLLFRFIGTRLQEQYCTILQVVDYINSQKIECRSLQESGCTTNCANSQETELTYLWVADCKNLQEI